MKKERMEEDYEGSEGEKEETGRGCIRERRTKRRRRAIHNRKDNKN